MTHSPAVDPQLTTEHWMGVIAGFEFSNEDLMEGFLRMASKNYIDDMNDRERAQYRALKQTILERMSNNG